MQKQIIKIMLLNCEVKQFRKENLTFGVKYNGIPAIKYEQRASEGHLISGFIPLPAIMYFEEFQVD